MKIKIITLVILALIVLNSFSQQLVGIPNGSEQIEIQNAAFEKEVLDLVNEIRKKNKLGPVEWQEDLARAARYHAQDMAYDNYMQHATFDKKNKKLVEICGTFERIEKFIEMSYLAENISAGKTNAKDTVQAWMKSKSHKANILNPNFKFLGVGYCYNRNSKYLHYWVQDFGG